VQRLGINRDRYLGETIDAHALIQTFRNEANRRGWITDSIPVTPEIALTTAHRPASSNSSIRPRFYLSAGVHGDEPAAPLALLDLIRSDLLPRDADLWMCPCVNPTGLAAGTRVNTGGIDLNRDYNHFRSREVAAHVGWLAGMAPFDLAILLHEDWESAGFYLYELNPDGQPTVAESIIQSVSTVCPIETATLIDGREVRTTGIIQPPADPTSRPDWPEAFWLLQNGTRHSVTLEAPSDFPLATRIAALTTATLRAMDAVIRR
jgi:protein MpaA